MGGPLGAITSLNMMEADPESHSLTPEENNAYIDLQNFLANYLVTSPLGSNETYDYSLVWEPNIIHGSTHTVAVSPNREFIATGGGYLSDNTVHIFTYNQSTSRFEHVWDSGDSLIQNDVMALAIDDLDGNGYYEVVAGSADGHVYIFEQNTPILNFPNGVLFNLSWVSDESAISQIWSIAIDDIDGDSLKDVVVGSWDGRVHVFEYLRNSGFPTVSNHSQQYTEVWDSSPLDLIEVYSVATGDTNANGFREIIVGASDKSIYIWENNGTDNSYNQIWNSSTSLLGIPRALSVGDLDGDSYEEVVATVYGFGVYIIAFNEGQYTLEHVMRPLQHWETIGLLPLDIYVDTVIYKKNLDDSDLVEGSPHDITYPYNSSIGGAPDDNYAIFEASIYPEAEVIVDFGMDEELTASLNDTADLLIRLRRNIADDPDLINVTEDYVVQISQNSINYTTVPADALRYYYFETGSKREYNLTIDVDTALSAARWNWFRYLRFVVKSGIDEEVDAIEGIIFRPESSALSLTIGSLQIDTSVPIHTNQLIMGTSDGRMVVYGYDQRASAPINVTSELHPGIKGWTRLWDSYEEDYFTLGDNIWSLIQLNLGSFQFGRMPTWKKYFPSIHDPHFSYLGNGTTFTFGNYVIINFTLQALIIGNYSGGYGNLHVYENTDTVFQPNFVYSQEILSMNPLLQDRQVAPTLADMNGDGTNDVIVGTILNDTQSDPGFYCWRNQQWGNLQFQPNFFETINFTLQTLNLKALPYATFLDIDHDGDLDLVVSCHKLLLFENTGTSVTPVWTHRAAFFESVNQHLTSNANYERSSFIDFDKDGDDDLIISINRIFGEAGNFKSRSEVMYFVQKGTFTEPDWIRDSEYLGRDFTGYHDPVILGSAYEDLYTMVLRNETGYMEGFHSTALIPPEAPVIAHDSFIVATYPRTAWVEIDRRDPAAFYGYAGYVSWDTFPELEDWTMAVKIGDMDSDGMNEVIVGSFDQNIYVFENLFNNTYRRAWRSPDLTRWEGTRRLWDDVTALALGDTDLDGLQEIIVATGTNYGYIFEESGSLQYVLTETLCLPGSNKTSFTTVVNDLDGDTFPEIIFASGSSLFFYEAPKDDTHLLTWVTEISSIEKINSLAMGTLDGDTRKDLVVVGINGTDGVVIVCESLANNTLDLVWTPPLVHYEENPAHSVIVYDLLASGSMEFLVGHDEGISIYHWNTSIPDDTYELFQLVSGSFNYLANHDWIDRKLSSTGYKDMEILQRADHSYVVLYQVKSGVAAQRLRIRTSSDGIHWSGETQVFSTGFDTLEEPTISETNDMLYLAFRGRRTSDGYEGIWLSNSSDGITWTDALNCQYLIPNSNVLSPKLTPSPNSNERFILTYIDPLLGINYTRNYWSSPTWIWSNPETIPLPVEVSILTTEGITAIDHDLETVFDSKNLKYRWVLVIEGLDKALGKTDTDIWSCYSISQPDTWHTDNWKNPVLITHSNVNETAPSLLGLEQNYMMVLYHSLSQLKGQVWFFGEKIWSEPTTLQVPASFTAFPMTSLTKRLAGGIAICYIATPLDGFDYLFVSHHPTVGWWSTELQEAVRVAIVDTNNDGMLEMIACTWTKLLVFLYNTTRQTFSQIWASQTFSQSVTDLAVGDTNGNYLMEIVITTEGGNVYAFEWTDREPPHITFYSAIQRTYTIPATIPVEVLALDAGLIQKVELCINNGDWIQAQPIDGTNLYCITFHIHEPGTFTIRVRALDHQGNWSPELHREIIVTTGDPHQPDRLGFTTLIYILILAVVIVAVSVIFTVARRRKLKKLQT